MISLSIGNRSEIAWKNANYAQILEYLREEYELTQRFGSLDFKLKFVEVNLFHYLNQMKIMSNWSNRRCEKKKFLFAAQRSFSSRSTSKPKIGSSWMGHHHLVNDWKHHRNVRDSQRFKHSSFLTTLSAWFMTSTSKIILVIIGLTR